MWVTKPAELRKLAAMTPPKFGAYCYENGIVPITCRFGQFLGDSPGQKALHAQLIRCAENSDRDGFLKIITDYYKLRVFSRPEAAVVAQILSLPRTTGVNRMTALTGFLAGKPSFGALSKKNFVEALLAQKVWSDAREEELVQLPDGPGADAFFEHAKIHRAEVVTYLQKIWRNLEEQDRCIEVFERSGTSATFKHKRWVKFSDLQIPEDAIGPVLAQYWSCAQGRVQSLAEAHYNNSDYLPYNLQSNASVRSTIAEAFKRKSSPTAP